MKNRAGPLRLHQLRIINSPPGGMICGKIWRSAERRPFRNYPL